MHQAVNEQIFTVYPPMQTNVLYYQTLYHVYPITNTCSFV
nr:MAG TPA: hypothetical protein [Caudoviricetes sp.]